MDATSTLYKAIADGVIDFDGAHDIHTPRALVEEILEKVPLTGSVLVLFNVEFVISLVYTYKVDPQRITFYSDHENKNVFCDRMRVKYITSLETDMKFDVVVGNPPFQAQAGKSKISIGTSLIKKFYNELVKDNGTLAMISASTFLGAGQKGLGYLFSQNKVIVVQLNHKNHFPRVGIDIGSFIIEKTDPTSSIIDVENLNSKMKVDTALFKYEKTKTYIPRNIDNRTLPILTKILRYNQEVFDFRASSSNGSKNKIGFWAGANTGIHPRYIKITNTGEFDSKWIDHPCKLDKEYPEDNIKSVFAGRWFHFVITMINGNQSDRRPANLSFFPKIDLNKKWTFDSLGDLFGMTVDEKQLVKDWAEKRSKDQWCD